MRELPEKIGYVPRRGVWELTLRCNMRCLHCGSRAGDPRGDELITAEALDLVRRLCDLGLRTITLSGGEPLLRDDWEEIATALAARRVRVNMITNGLLVDLAAARRMKRAGMANLAVSIDGLETRHDAVRARRGSWRAAVGALRACREEGLPTACVSHLNRHNFGEMEALAEILLENGVSDWQLQFGRPMGNLADHQDLVCPPSSVLELLPRMAALARRYEGRLRVHASDSIGYYSEDEELLRGGRSIAGVWTGCLAGCRIIGIEANGGIKGCLSMQSEEFLEGNIRSESLADIWRKPGNFRYTREFTVDQLGPGCRSCDLADVCRGGCSWTAWMEGGRTGKFDNPYCYRRQIRERGG